MSKLLFTTSSFNLENLSHRQLLTAAGFECILNPKKRRLTEDEVLSLMDDEVVGMVAGTEPLTDRVMKKAGALRVIARCGTGLDNVDLNAANQHGIQVYNTPNAPTAAVAELTLAHILSLSRHVASVSAEIKSGVWKPAMGRLIGAQTIGVIGFGRIGQSVAKLLSSFGARVLVYDAAEISIPAPYIGVSFEALLRESDIITLHIPYMRETHHLIDSSALNVMKENALLINVSRGGLIDESALLSALEKRQVAGAALDCFEHEPYSGPLQTLPTVQMTAHMGSYAKEARTFMEQEACHALVSGLSKAGLFHIDEAEVI